MPSPLAWTADVLEVHGDHVLLHFEDAQRVKWPRHLLPPDIQIGARVWLAASSHALTNHDRHRVGRTVLNELLHGS